MLLDNIYNKRKSNAEKYFDNLKPSFKLNDMFTSIDYQNLYNIASSIRYNGKLKKKKKAIDDIMTSKGFVKFESGTNRVIYRPIEFNDVLIKIPFDYTALTDNLREFQNQNLLKPFCSKIFEVSPNGSVALCERARPILHTQEFLNISSDIFNVIKNCFVNKYIIEDFGTKFFMNWGVFDRGPGLIDFPYVFKLDGRKLICNHIDKTTNRPCNGEIDYDSGFNFLYCKRCGKKYIGSDLEVKDSGIKIIGGNEMNKSNEKVVFKDLNGNIIKTINDSDKKINILNDGDSVIDLSNIVNEHLNSEKSNNMFIEHRNVIGEKNGVKLVEITHELNKEYKHFKKENDDEKDEIKTIYIKDNNKDKKRIVKDEAIEEYKNIDVVEDDNIEECENIDVFEDDSIKKPFVNYISKKIIEESVVEDGNIEECDTIDIVEDETIEENDDIKEPYYHQYDNELNFNNDFNIGDTLSKDSLDKLNNMFNIDESKEIINEDEVIMTKLKNNENLVNNIKKEDKLSN